MHHNILETLRHELLTRTSLRDIPEDVWKRAGALNTWGTNAIEGNTLTWRDVQRLILDDKSVGNRPIRDVMETLQHQDAFRGLLVRSGKPISLSTVLELHEQVFRGVKPDAGLWRRVNVRIVGSKSTPPRMEKVLPLMEEWVSEYQRRDVVGESVFFVAAWMHHRFESIHPFSDGNGRVGRLLLNLHFIKHSWPPVHILPAARDDYLKCLREAESGDLSGFESFLRVHTARSLLDLLDQLGTKDDELKPLKQLQSKGPYSAQYLSLRAGQGELPAVMVKGDWHSSLRALEIYRSELGRATRSSRSS